MPPAASWPARSNAAGQVVKRTATLAARGAELAGLLRLLELTEPKQPGLLRVLAYHRIGYPARQPTLYPGLLSATPEGFAAQLEVLQQNQRVISLQDILEARRCGRPLPPGALLLTFDDADLDFAEFAWPALRRHELPATLFVPTAFPDQPDRIFWWDRLYHAVTASPRCEPLATPIGPLSLATPNERFASFKRLRDAVKRLPHDEAMKLVDWICDELGEFAHEPRVLSWDQLRGLARDGVTLAPHSRTHPLMNQISVERMRDEAAGSRRDIEREIGSAPPVFAYPSGGFDDRVADVLREEGFDLAFTTLRGVNDMRTADPLRLRRINVGLRTSGAVLRTQLLSTVGRIQRWWLPA
jgi:peptidoglycan/xylan/chitin deacetylase (PgdA/CDA1 family)